MYTFLFESSAFPQGGLHRSKVELINKEKTKNATTSQRWRESGGFSCLSRWLMTALWWHAVRGGMATEWSAAFLSSLWGQSCVCKQPSTYWVRPRFMWACLLWVVMALHCRGQSFTTSSCILELLHFSYAVCLICLFFLCPLPSPQSNLLCVERVRVCT